ncbi:MAG: hypothetical protein WEC35_07635 [Nitrosopumilaceae archaeon]
MKRFSDQFRTFFDWQNQASDSTYSKRIERLHYRYPTATLRQLTGKARLSRVRIPIHLTDPRGLTPKELAIKNQSLHLLNRIRRGQTLDDLDSYISIKNSLGKYLGDTIKIKDDKIRVKKSDQIPRLMIIDENGSEFPIVVTNSKDASNIGKYFNAKRNFLETGDASELKKFSKIKIKDADGNVHRFETNPNRIYEIEDRKEGDEFFEIYKT